MNLRSIRIGRLAGVPIGFQPLWFAIVALLTWQLGAFYYPDEAPGISPGAAYALGLLSALLLFASILVHELGHAVVARRHGVEIEEIDLWLLGGVARMRGYAHEARDELSIALAGPAVTLAVAGVFWVAYLALPSSAPDSLTALVGYQAFVNTAILAFNLLPAFPLDGGRVAKALIWMRTHDMIRATSLAATIGRGFGYVMIALGLFGTAAGAIGGLWFAIIGFFIVVAARGEEAGVRLRAAFAGREAGRIMSFPAVTIPAATTVEEAVERFFIRYRYSSFPVIDAGKVIGLLGMEAVARVPPERRTSTPVGEVADRDPELVVDERQDLPTLLERPAFQRTGRAIVLRGSGEVGITSITDVRRALRALELRSEGRVAENGNRHRGAPSARATHD